MTQKKVYVAYSGGIDSTVLLHMAVNQGLNPTAIHVDHNLQDASKSWAQHCKQVAQDLDVEIISEAAKGKPKTGESTEAWARNVRYDIFKKHVKDHVLFVGQHADDQAETVLLQLMRGAGPKGLSAMAESRLVDNMQVVRPLLTCTQLEINAYAQEHNLTWVEDNSNKEVKFKRNAIRHEVLPQLKKHFPDCLKTISRSAELCANYSNFVEEWVSEELAHLVNAKGELLVKSEQFKNHSLERQNFVIRGWLESKGVLALNHKHMGEIHKLIHAEHWHQAVFKVGELTLSRTQKTLVTHSP